MLFNSRKEVLSVPRYNNSDDRVVMFPYNAARGESKLVNLATRRGKSVSIILPKSWVLDNVLVYGFVTDSEGRYSMSSYVTLREPSKEEPIGQLQPEPQSFQTFADGADTQPQPHRNPRGGSRAIGGL